MPSITVSGASGMIGRRLVDELQRQGWEVTILSREPVRAQHALGEVETYRWDPVEEPAPVQALAGRDAVAHLAGAPVSQRWTPADRRAIRDSRVTGTENLVAALREAQPRPGVLVSSSASGYYGARGSEPVDEEASPGRDFLAEVCVAWEAQGRARRAARDAGRAHPHRRRARPHGRGAREDAAAVPARDRRAGRGRAPVHAVDPRRGRRRDVHGGARRRALGGTRSTRRRPCPSPTASSRAPWDARCTARRSLPVPGLRAERVYGEMAQIVTSGVRAVPAKPLMLSFPYRHPQLDEALRSALGR